MSGEQKYLKVGIFMLAAIGIFLLLAISSAADEATEDTNDLTADLVNNQMPNGSWDNDLNTTANALWDLSFDYFCCATIEGSAPFGVTFKDEADDCNSVKITFTDAAEWTTVNYEDETLKETDAFITLADADGVEDDDLDGFSELQISIRGNILLSQEPDGSWNNDVGDTAIVTYALRETRVKAILKDEEADAVEKGVEWIQKQEDEKEHSWGSVEDDSKAIMALDSTGIEVGEEIDALMLKQKSDGSFGDIQETAWAVIALSTNPNKETMGSMEKAMDWLRAQDYDNNKDLAMAALAEQHYEEAKLERQEGTASGFVPPPWLYVLSTFVIGSLVLSYWLFARLDRNEVLDGVRKDIYVYITEHPGEHMANITKTLNLSSSSTRYHLSVLEGMDKIVSHKNGKYKRYYINKNGYSKYTNGNGYKHIMSALKNNTARRIVKFLISHPGSNQKYVSNALNIHPSTVNWHAKRLRDAEIISKQKRGKEIYYSLNHDVQLRKVIGIIEGSPA